MSSPARQLQASGSIYTDEAAASAAAASPTGAASRRSTFRLRVICWRPLVAVLDGAQHFGIGFTDWSSGTEPWLFGYEFSWASRAFQTYLYTDRPVYRSGQPVYFRGVVRSKDDVVYMPAPLDTVPVVIRDARGEIVYERELALSEFGSFSGQFDIAPDASLGAYSLTVDLPAEDIYRPEGGSIGFLVAEYRLPEYQVTLSPDQPEVVQGDTGRDDGGRRIFLRWSGLERRR